MPTRSGPGEFMVERPSRPPASSASVRRRMQATPKRDTACELALRRALHKLGLRYRVDAPIPGTRRRADVVFSRVKVAVFVDGCFWHGCPDHGTWPKSNAEWWRDKIEANRRRDRDTDQRLEALGWTVMRFWEHTDGALAAHEVAARVRGKPNERRIRHRSD
jgi:DNA mismatch endonuclease (patch repair protein)